jgi:hypothetical protein
MTDERDCDLILEELSRLPPLAPDPERSERTRRACHARLSRNAQSRERTENAIAFAERVAAPFIIGIFSAMYAVALIATALRLGELSR